MHQGELRMMKNIVIKKSIENDEIQKLFRKMFDVF